MRINLLLFCCTLLATCQPPLDPPSDSKASSNSSSASSPIIENNVDLRMLFTRMRTNYGLLFDKKGLGYSFQGEAYETTKGEGFLTNGDQGIFFLSKRSRHLRYSTVRIYWPRESLTEKRAITYGKRLGEPIYI